MSASDTNSSIYMTDKPNEIKNKVNKHAFSGGQALAEDHRKYGGNPDVDVPYQYLGFLLDDDDEYERLANEYRAGNLLSGEMKKICIGELQKFVANFQESKSKVTDEVVKSFMDIDKKIDGFAGKWYMWIVMFDKLIIFKYRIKTKRQLEKYVDKGS